MPGFLLLLHKVTKVTKREGHKLQLFSRRRGFTLISMLIVIVITGVLAAMIFMSSSEAIATARAAAIIANLETLKKATVQWYINNREKVQPDGRVKIDGVEKPIQEWKDDKLHISSYLSATGGAGIQLASNTTYDSELGNQSTNLVEGYYGICDGGTVKNNNSVIEYHRNAWFVGYRFTKSEENVREKIRGRMTTSGVFLGTPDAHQNTVNNQDTAVWMRVF